MFEQLITISRNTFTESIRQPIYVVLIMLAALALVLNPQIAAYTLDDDNAMLLDMGLSMLFIAGLVLAAFTATGVLSAEIENKTVLTVVSKPVPRALFVLGKYLGVSAAIGLAYWILMLIFLLTIRHRVMQTASDLFDGPVLLFGTTAGLTALLLAAWGNFYYQWSFTSTFVHSLAVSLTAGFILVLFMNRQWQFQSPLHDLDGQLLLGLLMVFEAVLILCAVAVAASTRLGQLMTLVICIGVFALGLVSNSVFGKFVHDYPIRTAEGSFDLLARVLGYLMYALTPNLQFLWPADALLLENPINAAYILSVTGYTLFYILAVMGLAVTLFQTREVG